MGGLLSGGRMAIAAATMLGMASLAGPSVAGASAGRVATLPDQPREQRKEDEAKRKRRGNPPGSRKRSRRYRHPKELRFVGWPGRQWR